MNLLRPLHQFEKEHLIYMLHNPYEFDLEAARVHDVDDGGMGSVRFVNNGVSMLKCIAGRQFEDTDGIPILVSINVDTDWCLFEIDI